MLILFQLISLQWALIFWIKWTQLLYAYDVVGFYFRINFFDHLAVRTFCWCFNWILKSIPIVYQKKNHKQNQITNLIRRKIFFFLQRLINMTYESWDDHFIIQLDWFFFIFRWSVLILLLPSKYMIIFR